MQNQDQESTKTAEVEGQDEVQGDDIDDRDADLKELRNQLVTACKVGDLKLLAACLQGLDEDAVNMELGSDKWTPLHIAAQVQFSFECWS